MKSGKESSSSQSSSSDDVESPGELTTWIRPLFKVGVRGLFWMLISLAAGFVGWGRASDADKFDNSLTIRIMMFLEPVTLVTAVIGLKLSWRTIGRHCKCIIYTLSVGAAVLVKHFQPENNTIDLIIVTCITIQIHALSQLLHLTSDIDIWDMLMGAVMQAAVYMTVEKSVYAFVVVLATCAGAILYKFFNYSTPSYKEMPSSSTKTQVAICV